jgi:hypothetical protein
MIYVIKLLIFTKGFEMQVYGIMRRNCKTNKMKAIHLWGDAKHTTSKQDAADAAKLLNKEYREKFEYVVVEFSGE